MPRRATKIVATLGPASSDPDLLEAMIRAGVNVVRLNFSHGKAQDHIDRAAWCAQPRSAPGARWPSWPTCKAPRSAWASLPKARCMLKPVRRLCSTPRAPSWVTTTAWAWTTRSCRAT
jgi:pyruvate kinase